MVHIIFHYHIILLKFNILMYEIYFFFAQLNKNYFDFGHFVFV